MQSELKEIYRRGLKQLEQREWQEAIDSFLAILRLDADHEDAFAMLKEAQKQKKLEELYKQGKEHFSGREWQKAINKLEEIHKQDPNYEGVADLLKKAREQKRLDDLYVRGMECARQGKWQNAVEIFEELYQADPNYMDVDIRLEEAKTKRQKQLDLLSLYNKAKGYEDIRDWDKAIDTYVKILAIDLDYEDVADRLAKANRRRKLSLRSESQKPRLVEWWNSLSTDGKAQVVLGVFALIVAVIFGIFGTPFASRWWSSVTRSGTPTAATTEIPIPTNTPSSEICNGSFEAGFECWEHGGALNRSVDCSGGNCVALLGDPDYPCIEGVPVGEAWICQTFEVPSNGVPKVSFRYRVRSFDIFDSVKGGDSFNVYINKGEADEKLVLQVGNMEWSESDCDGDPWDSGWESFSHSIDAYKGQHITLCFSDLNTIDKSWNTWTYVDDVRILP